MKTYPGVRGFKYFPQDLWLLFLWYWQFLKYVLVFFLGLIAGVESKPDCKPTLIQQLHDLEKP